MHLTLNQRERFPTGVRIPPDAPSLDVPVLRRSYSGLLYSALTRDDGGSNPPRRTKVLQRNYMKRLPKFGVVTQMARVPPFKR